MLDHTFIHIQGIGRKTEQRLWERGIRTWEHFLTCSETIFSPARDEMVRRELEASFEHREDILYFIGRLSSGDTWRMFDAFRKKAVYLDIETSGGYQGIDEITVIGLYNGDTVETFINGINLDEFEAAMAKYDLVITFSGSNFDLPFIRRWFPGIILPPAHIDLRFLMRGLGYRGGLKKIEKELGVVRNPEIDGMNGYDAVMLWIAYQWGDRNALEKLIQYNTADIVNLEHLMELGYREMRARALSRLRR
ncbi:MAG: ribonuclease H-like domain-containing protein [Pseudomonadota bacterium]